MVTTEEIYDMYRRIWGDSLKGNKNKDTTLPEVIYEEEGIEKRVPLHLLMEAPEQLCEKCRDEQQENCLECPHQPEWFAVTPEDEIEVACLNYMVFKRFFEEKSTINNLRLYKAAENIWKRLRDNLDAEENSIA